MDIIENIIYINPGNRSGRKLTGPKYIAIHNTANPGVGAVAHARYLYSDEAQQRQVSWHYSVDDGLIVRHLPLDEVGWHCGDGLGPGNTSSIGIEICEVSSQASANRLAAELVASLLTQFSLPIDAVKQHHDFYPKDCPRLLRGKPGGWEYFLRQAEGFLKPSDPDALLEAEYKRNPWLGVKLYAAQQPEAPYKLLITQYGVVWVDLSNLTSGIWPTGEILGDKLIASGELTRF